MSKIIVMRNAASDPPYVLKNRLGRPLKLSQNSKIGVTNINLLRPSNYEFVTNTMIGIGYINNGNNSAFQLVQQIPDGQYTYDTFARAVQNCLNNMFIPYNAGYNTLNRPPNGTYDLGDGNYILAVRLGGATTNTSCGIIYNSNINRYTITLNTTPTSMLSPDGSDCTSLVNINFTPNMEGRFNVVQPAAPGVQTGIFKLATAQSTGSFIFGHRITLDSPGQNAYHTRTSLTFVNTTTGRIEMQLDALFEYLAANNILANAIVNNGKSTTNKHINMLSAGSAGELDIIFHRFAGKCGVTFYKSQSGGGLGNVYTVLGTHSMDIESKFWDNTIYDINYSCDITFKDITNPYEQRGAFHSPIVGAPVENTSSESIYVNNPPQLVENQLFKTIKERARGINTLYFNEIMRIQEENEMNGIIDIPTQIEDSPDSNVEVVNPSTLEFYLNPLDCSQKMGFLYKSQTPLGALAYYFKSSTPVEVKTISSDYGAILETSEENQCVILIRGVPVSGICSDDYGSGNSFNVLDSLSLMWNEKDGYIANFRPPIMQSVQNKEIMTLTELELNLVGPDGMSPLEMAAGAVVSIYITGVIE